MDLFWLRLAAVCDVVFVQFSCRKLGLGTRWLDRLTRKAGMLFCGVVTLMAISADFMVVKSVTLVSLLGIMSSMLFASIMFSLPAMMVWTLASWTADFSSWVRSSLSDSQSMLPGFACFGEHVVPRCAGQCSVAVAG